jgi:hypothetical protein
MSQTSQNRNPSSVVPDKLRQLRRQLTGWILVHGLGRWLMALLAVLVLDMLLDRVFKMDFAQRLIMLAVIATVGIGYFLWRVIKPLLFRPNDDALIYEVESKHPELNENLISSWQLAQEQNLESMGVSEELALATIRAGIAKAEQIDFGNSLDRFHHRQNWVLLLAGLAVAAVLGIGVFQTDFLRTWFNRNVLLTNDQWPQATYLEIAGVENGKLVLPRGADHRQLVLVTENSTIRDVKVLLEIDSPGGRTRHQMKPTGKLDGRENAHLFHHVSSRFRFRATGGDDTTDWVEVELVEPPAVIELDLIALLPAYTGVPALELSGSGPHSILGGSRLQVQITANKLLQAATLNRGQDQFVLTPVGGSPDRYSTTLSVDQLRGGEYSFVLRDESGLSNSRPSKFNLTIKEDQPPKSRATLLGISGLIVPRAMLPVSYQVADEYGLRRLYFDCQWKTGTEDSETAQAEQLVFSEFETSPPITREVKDYTVLDLIPLKLIPGFSFRFAIAAEDTRPETPGIGKSQEFLLRVVTDEELRADLLRREIEQRKSFEQAYEIQMELASEIQAVAARQIEPGTTLEQFNARRETELIALVRNQKSIGTSIARVADRFEEFLVEVKNNRLDEAENELEEENKLTSAQKLENRFDFGIIQPIRTLDRELISLATRNLDNCRRAANDEKELLQSVDQTSLIHQQVLVEMKRILDAMNNSEDFQELLNDLLEIKGGAENVKRGIEEKLKPKDVFEDEKNIFDE